MTIEDLAAKMDDRFNKVDAKLDTLSTTVAVHTTTLATHDRENKGIKDSIARLVERVAKLEAWKWFCLGAGGAAGAGVAKLFM